MVVKNKLSNGRMSREGTQLYQRREQKEESWHVVIEGKSDIENARGS
jgi:hypothetical protein